MVDTTTGKERFVCLSDIGSNWRINAMSYRYDDQYHDLLFKKKIGNYFLDIKFTTQG